MFGFEISHDSMVNWINEAKRMAAPTIDKIKEYIMPSAVVGFDETGYYCNKRLDLDSTDSVFYDGIPW